MQYHMLALCIGCVLDLILGDPYAMPHPIRLIGRGISYFEKKWNKEGMQERTLRQHGRYMVEIMLLLTVILVGGILFTTYWIHPYAGVVVEAIMTYQILAMKCLRVESMKVYKTLNSGDLEASRKAVSMIVGRDTAILDEIGVAKAAIETVAENSSDGVLAPLLYLTILGPVGGFLYKTVNTMDSMVGYKDEKYLHFGRTAAKLDDICNYVPARVSGWLIILSAYVLGAFHKERYSGKRAAYIFKRDRYNHASPNSAQTEAACAGALGIQLAGPAFYFGKRYEKPYIGDKAREVEFEDIKRANRLMYVSAFICWGICILLLGGIYLWIQ